MLNYGFCLFMLINIYLNIIILLNINLNLIYGVIIVNRLVLLLLDCGWLFLSFSYNILYIYVIKAIFLIK